MSGSLERVESVPDPLDYQIGEITASNSDTPKLRLKFDRIALHNGKIMHISVIGAAGHLKQFRAIMSGAGKSTSLEAHGPRVHKKSERYANANLYRISYDTDGYVSEKHNLDHGKAHMHLWSKSVGFIRIMSDRAIFDQIKRSSIKHPMTCPFIFDWMEWAKAQMVRLSVLEECHCYRCDCGVFSASSETLAEIIKRGLESGDIRIPDPPSLPAMDIAPQVVYQPAE